MQPGEIRILKKPAEIIITLLKRGAQGFQRFRRLLFQGQAAGKVVVADGVVRIQFDDLPVKVETLVDPAGLRQVAGQRFSFSRFRTL
jgi:hypothetical protein